MSPQLDDVFFTLIEVLVSLVQTLENLGHISHVENVVTLCWSWQELVLDDVEQVDSGNSQWLRQVLDFFIENLEFEGSDSFIDSLHVSL